MSATTVQLLKVASEMVGGDEALAERLGIGAASLARYMADSPALPDSLLLRAVDIVLDDRRYRVAVVDPSASSFRRHASDGLAND